MLGGHTITGVPGCRGRAGDVHRQPGLQVHDLDGPRDLARLELPRGERAERAVLDDRRADLPLVCGITYSGRPNTFLPASITYVFAGNEPPILMNVKSSFLKPGTSK